MNLTEYVKNYGDISYAEKGFCAADSFAICTFLYLPIEQVTDEKFNTKPQKTLRDAVEDMYTFYNGRFVSFGVFIGTKLFRDMYYYREKGRFFDMPIYSCKAVCNTESVVQFAGITLGVDDDTMLVVYRGTDDTLVGWQEDVDIYVKDNIPSQRLSVEYLEEAATAYPDKKIIIIGHSKGGYLSLYAALNCSLKTRERIKAVFNNDGPGFKTPEPLYSNEYQRIKPIYYHYIPQSSQVGLMLYHDDDYKVVKSSAEYYLQQHDISTWLIENGDAMLLPELSKRGKIREKQYAAFLLRLDEKRLSLFYEAFVKLMFASGNGTLSALYKTRRKSLYKTILTDLSLPLKTKTAVLGLAKDLLLSELKARALLLHDNQKTI